MSIFSKIFSKPPKDELMLVFDIGSSSVGGALFFRQKSQNSKVPKIILSVREPIALESQIDPERFLFLTMKALESVASRICVAGLGAPEKIFCVLSSPWYASQTRIIKLEKNAPFTFTAKLADSLIKKEISFFKEEHSANYGKTSDKVRHFELKNIKTMLNGYSTREPIGKSAKELEMTIFVSMSGERVLQKIEEVIFRHFHERVIKYSSFIMAAFTVVRDAFIHHEDFLLIDIGGEMTDISMIKRGALRESVSFPLGFNFLVRKVAATLKCTLGEARSFIYLYKDRHAGGRVERKLEPIISKLKIEWRKSLEKSLTNLSGDISIPQNIFITAPEDWAQFFKDIIEAEEFNQYTFTEAKFKFTILSPKELHGMATFNEDVTRDPFLIIESVYLNRSLK